MNEQVQHCAFPDKFGIKSYSKTVQNYFLFNTPDHLHCFFKTTFLLFATVFSCNKSITANVSGLISSAKKKNVLNFLGRFSMVEIDGTVLYAVPQFHFGLKQ
jgi:hypothetical protein